MREKFTIDGSHFSNMAGFYDKVERVFTFGLDLIFTPEHCPGTILTTGKPLFSSGWRKTDIPSTGSCRMENLLTTRRNCLRLKPRQRWRTGAIRS